ncbi:MAG: hypothetical protein HY319_17795 [Armatimonadetes bacterium]|nr:hypothetical protein [Armatimonadota bacterium]
MLRLLILLLLLTGPAFAQLMVINGDYRVVMLDKPNQRLGVALREDDPDVRQNWLYVKPNTEILVRVRRADGSVLEERPDYDRFYGLVRKGDVLQVHGGRDWDGSLDAKRVTVELPADRVGGKPSGAASSSVSPGASYVYFENYEWEGTVEDLMPEAVLLKDDEKRTVLVSRRLQFRRDDRWIDGNSLTVGDKVVALVPGGRGELLSANYRMVTLKANPGVTQVPLDHLPEESLKNTIVPVLESGGRATSMPMDRGLDLVRGRQAAILDPAYHKASNWKPSGPGHAVLLEVHPEFVLLAIPTAQGLAVRRLAVKSAGALAQMTPGSAVQFKPQGGGLQVYQWARGEVKKELR